MRRFFSDRVKKSVVYFGFHECPLHSQRREDQWEEKLEENLKMNIIRAFFSKNTFFNFEKGRRRLPLSHLVARLWVWLNIPEYPWISLNILENTWINCSSYARVLNIHDHLREHQQLGFVMLNGNLAVSGWLGLACDR